MDKRTCPKCKIPLGNHDSYFCSSCGTKLPKDLVKVDNTIRVRTYSPTQPEVSKGPFWGRVIRFLKNPTFWAIFGLLIFILFVLSGIYGTGIVELIGLRLLPSMKDGAIVFYEPPRAPESNKLSLLISLPDLDFGERNLVSHVPADVDFYFEGSNIVDLLSLNIFSKEDLNFTPKANVLLEPEFSGFAYDSDGENRWGYIFIPKDVVLAQDVFGGGWGDYWKIAFIEDYMVVANNEGVFDRVKSVDGGINLSLEKNPEFVKLDRNLETLGQLRVFLMSDGAKFIVRNSLGGLNQETIGMINKVLITGFNSLVVSNQNDGK